MILLNKIFERSMPRTGMSSTKLFRGCLKVPLQCPLSFKKARKYATQMSS